MILWWFFLCWAFFAVAVGLCVILWRQQQLIRYLEEHWVPGPALVAGLIARGEVKR